MTVYGRHFDYQLLLKRRSNSPHVRRRSLSALSALVSNLEQGYVASIPFAMPFLSELLKDDVVDVAATAHITLAVFPRFWRIGF
jgi:U3 small nucleolar RNA-associated protein 10